MWLCTYVPLYHIVDDELLDLFTIDEAVEKMGFGVFQLLMSTFVGFVWVSTYLQL